MFGGFRKRVTQQTIELVRQPYAVFQQFYGIPRGFWQDEFVLGFFGVMIGMISHVVGKGGLSQTDKGHLLQDTFSALSNMNGAEIAGHFTQLAFQKPKSDAFELGGNNGEIVTLALFGKIAPTARDVIDQARREAVEQGSMEDLGVMILTMKFFVQPLIERFDLPS